MAAFFSLGLTVSFLTSNICKLFHDYGLFFIFVSYRLIAIVSSGRGLQAGPGGHPSTPM